MSGAKENMDAGVRLLCRWYPLDLFEVAQVDHQLSSSKRSGFNQNTFRPHESPLTAGDWNQCGGNIGAAAPPAARASFFGSAMVLLKRLNVVGLSGGSAKPS